MLFRSISPEDLDGYVEVSRALDMAVAGGENDFTKFGFKHVIDKRAMDIIQPDVCAAGGITECKKIAALAQAAGIQCVPHAWGTAIGLVATSAANIAGRAASIVVSAPVAIVDPRTRAGLGDQMEDLGGHVTKTMSNAAGAVGAGSQ